MITDSILSLFKGRNKEKSSINPGPIHVVEVRYHPSGREWYVKERTRILLELKPGADDPEGVRNQALVFEQFSFEECFLICITPGGNLTFLSDKGRCILAELPGSPNVEWHGAVRLVDDLLPHTTKRDDYPLTGFGHATFFIVKGRNTYISRKHIPIIEKEKNGFRALHTTLLDLKTNLLKVL